VQTAPLVVHLLWYAAPGCSWADADKATVAAFVSSLGGSTWWNVVQRATDASGHHVTGNVTLGSSVDLPQTLGSSWNGSNSCVGPVSSAISDAQSSGLVPTSTSAFYYLLTTGVQCNQVASGYAGWHTIFESFTIGYGYDIANIFLMNEGHGIDFVQASVSGVLTPRPTSNGLTADLIISVLAHEMAEAATDMAANAWYGTYQGDTYEENGVREPRMSHASQPPDSPQDACAYFYGPSQFACPAGQSDISVGGSAVCPIFNEVMGGGKYLIQQIWDVTTNKCSGGVPPAPPPHVQPSPKPKPRPPFPKPPKPPPPFPKPPKPPPPFLKPPSPKPHSPFPPKPKPPTSPPLVKGL